LSFLLPGSFICLIFKSLSAPDLHKGWRGFLFLSDAEQCPHSVVRLNIYQHKKLLMIDRVFRAIFKAWAAKDKVIRDKIGSIRKMLT
jgi:hypothetical protein